MLDRLGKYNLSYRLFYDRFVQFQTVIDFWTSIDIREGGWGRVRELDGLKITITLLSKWIIYFIPIVLLTATNLQYPIKASFFGLFWLVTV
jgi:hypothetical protein